VTSIAVINTDASRLPGPTVVNDSRQALSPTSGEATVFFFCSRKHVSTQRNIFFVLDHYGWRTNKMPCPTERQDVANVVLDVIRAIEGRNNIVETTVFGQDLIVDELARRNYASPIITTFEKTFPGCPLSRFGPATCANAGRVRDIVEAMWNEVRPV
jgi:hypothetical protein